MLPGIMRPRDASGENRQVRATQLAFGEVNGQRRVALGQMERVDYGGLGFFAVSVVEERVLVIDGKATVSFHEVQEWHFPVTYEAWSLPDGLDSDATTYLPFDWVHRHAAGGGDAVNRRDLEAVLYHLLVIAGHANRESYRPADEVLRTLGVDAVRWALRVRSTEPMERFAADWRARYELERVRPGENVYRLTGDALMAAVTAFMQAGVPDAP